MEENPDTQSDSGFAAVRARFDNPEQIDPIPIDDQAPVSDPGPDGGPAPHEEEAELLTECAQFPLNDTGNAMRFARYCGDDAMNIPRVGWHVWDGRRWKLDPDGIAVRRLAQGIHEWIEKEIPFLVLSDGEQRRVLKLENVRSELRDLPQDGQAMTEEETEKKAKLLAEMDELNTALWGRGSTRQRHKTFAKSSGNSGQIKNMLTEAVTSLSREVDELNADPLTVNTETGVLRFRVDDMREDGGGKVASFSCEDHARSFPVPGTNRTQYITKMMPVEYDPKATCPQFDAFLARVQPDPEIRAFLQRWFGLSMTANKVQKFLYMYGMGANGKSLLANLMRRMMGDYATMVRIESLTGKNRKSGSDATPDLMKLIGARAAITNEPEEGERLQEQKVKEMTGGDEMLVRALHSDFVEFTPYFKLTFTGNHKLEIRGTDDGIWRRPMLLPFDVQIPEAERDEKLGDRLFEEERSGILNWMIAGLVDYLEAGLQEPKSVLDATEEYRKDSDPIGDFLGTACIMDGGDDWTSARDLIDACYLYQLENHAHSWTTGTLSRRLKERSGKFYHPASHKTYTSHKRGVNGYLGLRLADDIREKLRSASRDSKGLPILSTDQDGDGSGGGY